MNRSSVSLLALMLAAIPSLACKAKGPAPGDALIEREEVVMAEHERSPSGTEALGIPSASGEREHEGYKGPHDPHGPAGHIQTPDSHVAGAVDMVDVGGLQFKAPEGWKYEHPTSSMRRAQFGIRDDAGSAGLVVYFFGDQGAGSAQANIERWVGQFRNPDGTPRTGSEPVRRKLAGLELTQVEVSGTYVGGMGSGPQAQVARPNQRMIATIVETPRGPFYFKFLGADQTVAANRKALDSLFKSMKLSE